MAEGYLREHGGNRSTEQSEPMREDQIENPAGGFVWGDKWMHAQRFLILGTEGGSYYVQERPFTREAAAAMMQCIDEDGIRAVEMIRDISVHGRAAKNGPALFALAMATAADNAVTRRKAWEVLPEVARIGTHLLNFCAYRQLFGGWGRGTRRGIGNWYTEKSPDDLAYQLIKYRQRDNWSQRDVLRKAHPVPPSHEHNALFQWVTQGTQGGLPRMVEGFIKAQESTNARTTARLIRDYGLPWEALKPDHLASPSVWRALIEDENMPVMAMIRNLARMARLGVLTPLSAAEQLVVDRIADQDRIRAARVHPIALLSALKIYSRGYSELGHGDPWVSAPGIVDALDSAFYNAFRNVTPAGKRTLLAFDVSGSMSCPVLGVAGLTARDAAAAMGLITAATEPFVTSLAFTGDLMPFALSGRERLDDVVHKMESLPFGTTDCALPMIYARHAKVSVETFIVYTDNETWAGREHPVQALRRYRAASGVDAKLIVVGTSATEFTVADPDDPGMLDVVGFDTAAPGVMAEFSRGTV
jgi:60 kDa SS-A/Ro ribonucleoprotein